MADGGEVVLFRRGHVLGEVFSVSLETLDNIDGEGRCKFYGTVKVADSVYWMDMYLRNDNSCFGKLGDIVGRCIYNREKEDYESIKPGEVISLTGPFPCIQAYDSFTLGLELWNYDNDEQVIRRDFTWDFLTNFARTFDILRSKKIDGIGCSLTVKYAVFGRGVQAFIEVKLINCYGKDAARVCGYLWAQDNLLKEEIQLFRITGPKEYIKVRPEERIPLSRSLVVASLESHLTVRADLYSEEDGKIAYGLVNFTPELSGTSTMNIIGDYGEVEVKITWIDA